MAKNKKKFSKDDGKEYLEKPIEITLENAIKEIDKFPTINEYENGFLNFLNGENQISFMRNDKNNWTLIVHIPKDLLISHNLNIKKVKNILKEFFNDKNWKSLCNFKKASEREIDVGKKEFYIEGFKEDENSSKVLFTDGLSKKELIKKLKETPKSTDKNLYGFIIEYSKPYILMKKSNGSWKVFIDKDNPHIDVDKLPKEKLKDEPTYENPLELNEKELIKWIKNKT